MQLKQLFADEDAVSPVIGVILMVAITVILAAVIGTFVLGLGENVQDSAPQANFQFEYSNISDSADQTVDITHTGGEDVDVDTLSILVGGTTYFENNATTGSVVTPSAANTWGGTVSTGDTQRIRESSDTFASGDDVRVVWTSPSGGTSNTIGQSSVPN